MFKTHHGLVVPNEIPGYTHTDHDWNDHPLWIGRETKTADGFKRFFTLRNPIRPVGGAGAQYYRDTLFPNGAQLHADPTAIAGTTEALIYPAVFTQLFAFQPRIGQQLVITAGGVMTTPASAATTLTLNPRWGTSTAGLTLGISNTSATATVSQTNVPWFMHFLATVRDIGAAASSMTIVGEGQFSCAAAIGAPLNLGGTIVTTADNESVQGIVFGAILGGSASWTMVTRNVLFETSG